jgi:secreted protein with Ig-like and vWFA domain/anti-sigma factor RsiW
MKLSPDSPELTAYALGELNPAERAAVEAALADSAELRAELDELQRTIGSLDAEFAAEPAVALSAAQRAAIVGQAASLPAADSVADEATRAAGLLQDGESSRQPTEYHPTRDSESRAPRWIARLLAWRQQLIWAAAGACALALTFSFWPRQRDAVEQFKELRYQTLPPAKDAPVAPPATASAAAADQRATAGGSRSESLESVVVTTAPTPARKREVSAAVAPAAQLVPGTAGPAPRMNMDPALARRYGGVPTSRPAPMVPPPGAVPEPVLGQRYGLAPSVGRDLSARSKPLVMEQSIAGASPGYVGGTVSSEAVAPEGWSDSSPRYRAIAPYYLQPGGEGYDAFADNDFKSVASAPLSTFSLDVDTASYANARRFLREGSLPPRDAVRLEELINYFRYDYPQPRGEHPFLASIEVAESPWKDGHKLVRLGLQARAVDRRERPAANLVFLVDVSGSMAPENKLPLVKRSLRLLLDRLTERDRVALVTYAAGSQVVAESTPVNADGKAKLLGKIEALRAGSGTHGSAGIQSAYALAAKHFNAEQVNRVILCSDGDFNVGITDRGQLLDFITERAKTGVFLSVLGYGLGNYQDITMELLADKGNGNYAYVDSFTEARKVLGEQLEGTLVTVAKDVKVQVEFNPARVKSYRLLGYENRALRDRDFNDDTKDAGEVGAGHQITVLYELEPAGPNLTGVDALRYQAKPEEADLKKRLKSGHGDELLNLKLRYKLPAGETSLLIETPVKDGDREFAQASADFKFATAVAGYGMLLRQSPHRGELTWEKISRLAEQGLGEDKEGYRAEFVDLVRRAQQLGGVMPMPEPMPVPMATPAAPGGGRPRR